MVLSNVQNISMWKKYHTSSLFISLRKTSYSYEKKVTFYWTKRFVPDCVATNLLFKTEITPESRSTHYISCLYYVIRGIIYHNHDGISWKEMNQIRQQPEESIGKTTRITMTLLPLWIFTKGFWNDSKFSSVWQVDISKHANQTGNQSIT